MLDKMKKEIKECTRLMNRMNDNNPRAAAKILAKRWGNHLGAIKGAREVVNALLAERGLPPVLIDWEGVAKAPSWYTGPATKHIRNDAYIGGGVNF